MRPSDPLRLRPGLSVVRRDLHHLQVGIAPPLCVVLPDEPGVRRLLDDLAEGAITVPRTARARQAWELLLSMDLLVDADTAAADPALAMLHGPEAVDRRRARTRLTVALDLPATLRPTARRALSDAGLRGVSAGEQPVVTLVADPGVVRRERLDELLRTDAPHLIVHGGPTGWTVGPFVVPGVTACVRCVDAAQGEEDPRLAFVLRQADQVRVPVDPLAREFAVRWAAQDLVRYAEGERPTTWSATVSLGRGFPRLRHWQRHPHCGCAWDVVLGEPDAAS